MGLRKAIVSADGEALYATDFDHSLPFEKLAFLPQAR